MAEVYLYVPKEEANDAIEFGLKLSEYATRDIVLAGVETKAIAALLNPKDDKEKYANDDYCCLKIVIDADNCYVADSCLYEDKILRALYNEDLVLLKEYIFGTKRKPECLISKTILSGISKFNKGFDIPLLFENSEELYVNSLLDRQRDTDEKFVDTALCLYYSKLEAEGKLRKIETENTTVFINENDKYIICRD